MRWSSRSKWAAALLWVSGVANATTLLAMDLPKLSKGSDVVVRGTVKKMESRWTGDHARIVTDVEIEVAETIKGAPPRTVIVVQPGGIVGDVGQRVSGLASFETGEEVVVFLERRGSKRFQVSGLSQGKYRVERSSDGKDAFAVPQSTGEALVLDPITRQPLTTTQGDRKALRLEDLKAQVLATVKEAKEAKPLPQKVP